MTRTETIVVGIRPQIHRNAQILHIVDRLAGAGQYLTQQATVYSGVGEFVHMGEQGVQRDPRILFLLDLGFAGSRATAHRKVRAVCVCRTLQNDDLFPGTRQIQSCHQTGSTSTCNDHIGIVGHSSFTQCFFFVVFFVYLDLDRLALGLCDTGIGSGLDCLGRNGGTTYVVHLGTLCLQNDIGKMVTLYTADVGSFFRNVYLDIGDGVGIKGHRDSHGTHTGGRGTISTRRIQTSCAGGAAGSIAGSQTGSGDTAHGCCGCDLQKSFTGDLFHDNSFLFLLYPSYRQNLIAVLVKSITFICKEKEVITSV